MQEKPNNVGALFCIHDSKYDSYSFSVGTVEGEHSRMVKMRKSGIGDERYLNKDKSAFILA